MLSLVVPEPLRTCRFAPVKMMCGAASPLIVFVVSTVTNWPNANAFCAFVEESWFWPEPSLDLLGCVA